MAELLFRNARAEDHDELSSLALRSKGYWGYSAAFLDACRAELTYDASVCGSGSMWVAAVGETTVGFSLVQGEPPMGELAALFIDPAAIGTGCGRRLLAHTLGVARQRRFVRLVLDADPEAEPFYLHCGARRIGSSPSGSIPAASCPGSSSFSTPASGSSILGGEPALVVTFRRVMGSRAMPRSKIGGAARISLRAAVLESADGPVWNSR